MKLLTIGSDKKLFERDSAVLARAREYAEKTEESHIIVFSLSSENLDYFTVGKLSVYPTKSASRWLYPFGAYKLAKQIIRQNNFVRGASVISVQDPFESGMAGALVKWKFRLPLHVQIHTDFFSSKFKNNFLNRIRLIISFFVIPRANSFRVVSSEIEHKIRQNYPSLTARIQVLPVFVDIKAISAYPVTKDLKKMFPQFRFIVLMVCRLAEEKGLETALYAFQKLMLRFPHTGLVIAGDGPERIKLQSLATRMGILDNVVFLGWQNDTIWLYKTAHLFISTSSYEGYGMSLLEAGASGCPIITTEVGLAKDLCISGRNSFVCPVGDSDCFADGMIELISDEGKRLIFRQEISSSAEKMAITKEEYIKKYMESLRSLVPLDPSTN